MIQKVKTIPVTCHGGLYGFEVLKIPYGVNNLLTDGGEVVSLNH
jgi:hypothetical protein